VILDPGKRRDPAAVMIGKQRRTILDGTPELGKPDRIVHFIDVVFAEQFIDKPYPELVEYVQKLVGMRDVVNNADLVVDATGVGEAVVDLMHGAGLSPIPILVTGGTQVHRIYADAGKVFAQPPGSTRLAPLRALKEIHVPRTDIIAAGGLVLEQGRVKIARSLKWAREIQKQLENLTDKPKPEGPESPSPVEAEEVHDDFAFAFCLLAWWFTRGATDGIIDPDTHSGGSGQRTVESWDPFDHL
jgi:hypothetical protein